MRSLLQFLRLLPRRQRAQAIGLFFFMLFGACLEAVGIGVVLPFLALVADPASVHKQKLLAALYKMSGAHSNQSFVISFGIALIIVYVAKNLLLALLAYAQYRFFLDRQAEMTTALFSEYLLKPYEYHLRRNSALLLRNVNQDVMLAFSNVVMPAATVLIESMVTLSVLALLMLLQPIPTLVAAVVFGGTAVGFMRAVRKRIQSSATRVHESGRMMIQIVNQGLEGIKEIKVLQREPYFIGAFAKHSWDYSDVMRYYRVVADLPRLFIEALAVAGILLIGVFALERGTELSSLISMLGLFALAAIRLMPALNRIVASMTAVRSNLVSFDAIYDDLTIAARRAEGSPPSAEAKPGVEAEDTIFRSALELRGVGFTYPGAHAPSLNGIDLTIRQGQSVALIGPSGAGKTTIVDLVLGLLVPTKGEILVDGKPLASVVERWQRRIGYIPQPIFLADDTIRNNVAFGVPDGEVDEAKVARALEIARLSDLVATLPDGTRTFVGERGVRISGGQRQRIGIARALYHDPEVLILDEATSALDNETENQIKEAINDLSRGRTLIIIAHRLTTVQECDLLFFLKDGVVLAAAPYEQLLASSPDFERMVKAGLLVSDKPPA